MKSNGNNLRLLVLGIDGATFKWIDPLIKEGDLPNFKKLMKNGCWGELCSTFPPVSACAWSSFMTGRNPGKHGIFHWRTYNPFKYTSQNTNLASNEELIGKTFWDVLGEEGYKVGVITVPLTYPVWEINGIMIAGYPCPQRQPNYAFPQEYVDKLDKSLNFRADYYIRAPDVEIAENGQEMLERRTSVAIDMISEEKLDVCVLVLGEIDRAQHDFWKYTDPSFSVFHEAQEKKIRRAIIDHYIVADKQLGRLLEVCSEETTVIVMSDHGGGVHPSQYFYTNSWLRETGFLAEKHRGSRGQYLLKSIISRIRKFLPCEEKLREILPGQLLNKAKEINMELFFINWEKTKAYRFPMYHPVEGIEINLKGRQANGVVHPQKEFHQLRQRLKDELENIKDPLTGNKVVERVFFREEIYKGKFAHLAPDIVFLLKPNYISSEKLKPKKYIGKVALDSLAKYNGVHTMHGIFCASGRNISENKKILDAKIIDIAPTILYTMGIPIPKDFDGDILFDIFEKSFIEGNKAKYTDKPIGKKRQKRVISKKDEEVLKDKLRGLGYID